MRICSFYSESILEIFPYDGAKEHYILDVEDRALVEQVLPVLEQVVPVPKKRKKE